MNCQLQLLPFIKSAVQSAADAALNIYVYCKSVVHEGIITLLPRPTRQQLSHLHVLPPAHESAAHQVAASPSSIF